MTCACVEVGSCYCFLFWFGCVVIFEIGLVIGSCFGVFLLFLVLPIA